MSAHLELIAKLGAVAIGTLTLMGGVVVGAARMSVGGVQAEVAAVQAKLDAEKEMTRARLRVVEDGALEDRASLRRIEKGVGEVQKSVEVLQRTVFPKSKPRPPLLSVDTPP